MIIMKHTQKNVIDSIKVGNPKFGTIELRQDMFGIESMFGTIY